MAPSYKRVVGEDNMLKWMRIHPNTDNTQDIDQTYVDGYLKRASMDQRESDDDTCSAISYSGAVIVMEFNR